MTPSDDSHRGRRRGLLAAAPTGVLALALLVACGSDDPGAGPTTAPEPAPATTTTAPAVISPTPAPEPTRTSGWQRLSPSGESFAAPVGLAIPAIDVDSEVVPVGTDDGVMQVPPEPWVVGWWSDGVGPGAGTGTVVLDAHLDSREYGKGPFTRAKDLEVGATATVTDDAGEAHDYLVTEVLTYEKVELPYEELFAQDGPERVVLVTCGGAYRRGSGWDSNVVVVMEPV
ncbi:MAG TPA: class F sortase [Jiangellales bacterium]|nr:class F sortase [Jiangellales bacterium]